jgi:DNA-binding MarR family transcriptional regulator
VSDEGIDALRVAFGQVLGAERRLRGREGRHPGELPLSHFRMLTCLLEHPRLPAGRLAAAADLTPASTTQMLDALEKRGMVVRERDPGDRRVVVVAITPEGRRVAEARRGEFRALWADAMGDLDEEQLAAGVDVLERVAHLLEHLAEKHAPEPAPA